MRGRDGLGTTTVNPALTSGQVQQSFLYKMIIFMMVQALVFFFLFFFLQAFGVEFLITMVLVLVVFASAADDNNKDNVKVCPKSTGFLH